MPLSTSARFAESAHTRLEQPRRRRPWRGAACVGGQAPSQIAVAPSLCEFCSRGHLQFHGWRFSQFIELFSDVLSDLLVGEAVVDDVDEGRRVDMGRSKSPKVRYGSIRPGPAWREVVSRGASSVRRTPRAPSRG